MLRAAGHSARGSARRSAVVRHPAHRAVMAVLEPVARGGPAPGGCASGARHRTRSKPSAAARSASAALQRFAGSEVQIRVMARRRHARASGPRARRGRPAGISPARTRAWPSRPRPMARRRDNPRRRDGPPRQDPHRSDRRPRASSGRRSDSRYISDDSAHCPAGADRGHVRRPAAAAGAMKRLKIFSVTR